MPKHAREVRNRVYSCIYFIHRSLTKRFHVQVIVCGIRVESLSNET